MFTDQLIAMMQILPESAGNEEFLFCRFKEVWIKGIWGFIFCRNLVILNDPFPPVIMRGYSECNGKLLETLEELSCNNILLIKKKLKDEVARAPNPNQQPSGIPQSFGSLLNPVMTT